VSIPRDTLAREGFCAAISTLINDMSAQSIAEVQPNTLVLVVLKYYEAG
jgi:hypothetical protein